MALNINNIEKNEETNSETKIHYKSQQGFIRIPILRGLTEISQILKDVLLLDGLILGGYARYCCSPNRNVEPAQDVDIYSPTIEIFEKFKLHYSKLEIRHENAMAITYQIPENIPEYKNSPTIQLIKPQVVGKIVSEGDIETILKNFDFTVIRIGFINKSTYPNIPTEAIADADFLHDEEHKLLRLKNIHCPVSSTLRCMKYSRKNYFLPPFQSLKLFLDWENRDNEYRQKLIDFIEKAEIGDGLSQEEIDELEEMMRID